MKTLKTIMASALAMSLALGGSAMAEGAKIGMITTLSGGGAGLGVDVRDGFMLAIEQAGRDDVEVVIEDDARKPDLAVQIADKMIQSEKVDILTGIIWSNLAMAVIPSAVAQGKIYVSPNAGPSALAGKGCNANYFNVAWQNDNLHEAMGAYANVAEYTNTFILAPNYPAGQDALNGFKREYRGNLAGEVFTKLGATDYAAEIAQIRDSGADSVFFFLPGGMGIAFMKQYAASGVDVPVMGQLSHSTRVSWAQWVTRRLACATLHSGAKTSTTKPTRLSLRRSKKSMTVCHRFMPAKALTQQI